MSNAQEIMPTPELERAWTLFMEEAVTDERLRDLMLKVASLEVTRLFDIAIRAQADR